MQNRDTPIVRAFVPHEPPRRMCSPPSEASHAYPPTRTPARPPGYLLTYLPARLPARSPARPRNLATLAGTCATPIS